MTTRLRATIHAKMLLAGIEDPEKAVDAALDAVEQYYELSKIKQRYDHAPRLAQEERERCMDYEAKKLAQLEYQGTIEERKREIS